MSTATYRILHVEDSPDDAELVALALRGTPYGSGITRVDAEPEFAAELEKARPDAVLCDYHLPRFSAERALAILGERQLDIPFIVISHHIGESAAVIAMQRGASDYLPKADLERLPKAIGSAIERCEARREKQRALESLRRSEAMRRGILDSFPSQIALLDGGGRVQAVNKTWEEFDATRTSLGVALPRPGDSYLESLERMFERGNGFARDLARGVRAVSAREKPVFSMEFQVEAGGAPRWYAARVMPLEASASSVVVSHLEVTERVVAHLALEDAHRRLQALSSRLLVVQEEERRAISRELHDDIGQTLGALKIGLHRVSRGGSEAPRAMDECVEAADAALAKLRCLSHELRPPQLEQLGLEEALKWLLERQQKATGIQVRFKCAGLEGRRPPQVLETACYRIAQEALNNASRHGQPARLSVALESDGRLLKLTVHDDGAGFDEAAARERIRRGESIGLIGMEERAQLVGGRVKVRSVQGGGTTVSAVFPLPQTAAASVPAGSVA